MCNACSIAHVFLKKTGDQSSQLSRQVFKKEFRNETTKLDGKTKYSMNWYAIYKLKNLLSSQFTFQFIQKSTLNFNRIRWKISCLISGFCSTIEIIIFRRVSQHWHLKKNVVWLMRPFNMYCAYIYIIISLKYANLKK